MLYKVTSAFFYGLLQQLSCDKDFWNLMNLGHQQKAQLCPVKIEWIPY